MIMQYHKIYNIDKQEYLDPHDFGDGMQLMQFCWSFEFPKPGTLVALVYLLSNSGDRYNGDFINTGKLMGSWAGNEIVIQGDYAKYRDPSFLNDDVLPFKNISTKVLKELTECLKNISYRDQQTTK